MDSDNPNEKSDDLPKSSASENVDASQSKDVEGENLEISNKNSYDKKEPNKSRASDISSDPDDSKDKPEGIENSGSKSVSSDDAEKNNDLKIVLIIAKIVLIIASILIIAIILIGVVFYGTFSEEVQHESVEEVQHESSEFQPKFVSTWNTAWVSNDSSKDYEVRYGRLDFLHTGSNKSQIKLPLGYYDITIDWGDGSTDRLDSSYPLKCFDCFYPIPMHTYENPGIYTITITGDIRSFSFNNEGDRNKLINITSWGPLKLGKYGGYFYGAENLETITATDVNLSGITNMAQMFRGASKFNGNISGWDVSEVTDMGAMFQSASKFDQDIGNWSVGKVANMAGMFSDAHNFNQDIGDWDVSRVKYMHGMFSGARNFDQDIGNWSVGEVANMAGMFSGARNFNQDISGWDVSRVDNMDNMFRDAEDFNQDLSNWNVCNVKSYSKFDHNSFDWDDHFKPSFGSKCINVK